MDNRELVTASMPRPHFEAMTDKALQAYLSKNRTYVSTNDLHGTRAQILATASLVADRKAEAFTAAKVHAEALEQAVTETTAILQQFPKGPMGLTPDEVKSSPEWQAAQHNFARAFQVLREFNGSYTKTFAAELKHERQARREAHAVTANS